MFSKCIDHQDETQVTVEVLECKNILTYTMENTEEIVSGLNAL